MVAHNVNCISFVVLFSPRKLQFTYCMCNIVPCSMATRLKNQISKLKAYQIQVLELELFSNFFFWNIFTNLIINFYSKLLPFLWFLTTYFFSRFFPFANKSLTKNKLNIHFMVSSFKVSCATTTKIEQIRNYLKT